MMGELWRESRRRPVRSAVNCGIAFMVFALVIKLIENHSFELFGLLIIGCLFFIQQYVPAVFVYAALMYATLTLPAGSRVSIRLFGFDIDLWEPLLVLATIYIWRNARPPRGVVVSAGLFGMAIAIGALVGFGNDPVRWWTETRFEVDMLMALLILGGMAYAGRLRELHWPLVSVLWVSAGLVVVSSTTGAILLAGRRAEADLVGVDAVSSAVRILTNTQFLALAVLCGCVALLFTGHSTRYKIWIYLVPAVLIVFLAFSRNTVIALAVTVVAAIALARPHIRFVVGGIVGAIAAWVAGAALLWMLEGFSFGVILENQVGSFITRAIGGLDVSTLARDPSAQYRVLENGHLVTAWAESPIIGGGFGAPYQDAFGDPRGFSANLGRFYAHNFYLWFLVKTGVVGLSLYLAAFLWPLIKSLARRQAEVVAFTAPAVALMVICFVVPLPNETPSGIVLGGLLGLVVGSLALQPKAGESDGRASVDLEADGIVDARPVAPVGFS